MDRFGWDQNHLVGDVLSLAEENEILEDSWLPAFPSSAENPLGMSETQIAKVCATPLSVTSGRAAGCKWVIAALFDSLDEAAFQPHSPTHKVRCLEEFSEIVFGKQRFLPNPQ